MQQNTNQQEFSIIAYDLATFLTQFQEAVAKGFRLDMTRNETYPQMINNQYWVTLVQSGSTPKTVELKVDTSEVKEIVEKALEEVKQEQEIQAKGKPGRKPKSE